jgi:hypothetical protein
MRALGAVALSCLACTRPNPAYDATTAGEGGQTEGPDTITSGLDTVGPLTAGSGLDTIGPDTVGPVTLDPDTSSPDLPFDPICMRQPAPGLSIQLGDPSHSGDVCPTDFNISTRIVSVVGSEVVVENCDAGCVVCVGDGIPLSVDLLPLGDLVPPDTCVLLEARDVVQQTETRCHWGALTIHDPLLLAPYVIATARSYPPTPAGLDLLAGAIPEPMPELSCNCDAIGQGNDCCYQGDPPSFWYYTIEGQDVHPGEDAPLDLADPTGLEHSFQLFQAEHIPGCQDVELQLSWAVVVVP